MVMGFTDIDKNRKALSKSGGRIQQSIEYIVSDSFPDDEVPLSSLANNTLHRKLDELNSMGFTDDSKNRQALSA